VWLAPQYAERISGLQIARWARNGGIYVQCNLRGGSEYGPKWHEDGMMMSKRHCYEDFIGVAEEIIRLGWTSPEKLAICGCSNGGLLMSALVTMRPDLWGCVLDSVPHTDMIHFVEDDRGPMYITEYGNPRESKEMFEYLLSYSPYHNVKEVAYPPVYIQTGELDNNVPPYHGKKFAARMQALNTSDNPILLRVLAEGSHDRGRGDAYWQTIAEMQLFLKYALKL
jgi:prolyl oligopeptidase